MMVDGLFALRLMGLWSRYTCKCSYPARTRAGSHWRSKRSLLGWKISHWSEIFDFVHVSSQTCSVTRWHLWCFLCWLFFLCHCSNNGNAVMDCDGSRVVIGKLILEKEQNVLEEVLREVVRCTSIKGIKGTPLNEQAGERMEEGLHPSPSSFSSCSPEE